MAYTQNVPQGNQQIASTQSIIESNFQYLQTYIGQDHNFDPTGFLNMYHKQCSMTNQAPLAGYPVAGANGVYYVTSNTAAYWDGTNNYNLSSGSVRAWVSFSTGAGPGFVVSINGSFNIASVVRNSLGNYTITYTTAMPSANYCPSIVGMNSVAGSYLFGCITGAAAFSTSVQTGLVKVSFVNNSGALTDPTLAAVSVLGF